MIIKILCIALLFISFVGNFLMWEQKDKDKEFNLNEIDPIVEIVEAYKSKNGSYPTLDGFNLLILGSRFENRITEYKSDSNSFHFSIWRGEWNESYSSKGNAVHVAPAIRKNTVDLKICA